MLYESQETLQVLIESLLSNSKISYQSSCGELNIEQNREKEVFGLFPNPASEIFTLTLAEKNLGGTLSIFNLMGYKLMEKKITENSFMINTSILQNGIYNLSYSNKGKIFNKKIVVIKHFTYSEHISFPGVVITTLKCGFSGTALLE